MYLCVSLYNIAFSVFSSRLIIDIHLYIICRQSYYVSLLVVLVVAISIGSDDFFKIDFCRFILLRVLLESPLLFRDFDDVGDWARIG